MAGKGGYQAPRNPAPVSGPGRLARRTDGGPAQNVSNNYTGLPYGQGQALSAQMHGAPMAQQNNYPAPPIVGLDEPSQMPDEPVTHGAASGPGGGPEVLSMNSQSVASSYGPLSDMLQQMAGGDTSGSIAALAQAAMARGL